jgi:hypothetical protein
VRKILFFVTALLLLITILSFSNVSSAWNNNPPLTKEQAFEKSTGAIHQQGYTINNKKPNMTTKTWRSWGRSYKRTYVYKNSHYRQVGTVLGWQYNNIHSKPVEVQTSSVTTKSLSATVSGQLNSKVGANINILSRELSQLVGASFTTSTSTTKISSEKMVLDLPKYTIGRYYGIGLFRWIDEYEAITYKKVGNKWVRQSSEKVYLYRHKPNQHVMWKYGTGK